MQTELGRKAFAVTTAILIPFAAGTIARIITNNPEIASNVFYITAVAEPLVLGGAASIARRRSRRR